MNRIILSLCLLVAACGGGGQEEARPEIKAQHDPQVVLPVGPITGASSQ